MTDTEKIYIIAGIIIIYIIYLIVISILRKKPKTNKKMSNNNAVKKQLLTEDKNAHYRSKSSVMPLKVKFVNEVLAKYCKKNNYVLYPKAKLADFLDPIYTKDMNDRDFENAFRQAKSVYVDFIICTPDEFQPLAVIMLDDRWIGDELVDDILEEANLEVFHIDDLDEDRINTDLDCFFKRKRMYPKYL